MTNPQARRAPHWAVFGASARGSAHAREARPNEDAVTWRSDEAGRWAVMAVADGHGHSVAVRADVGARLAVTIAVDEARLSWQSLSGADVAAEARMASRLQEVVVTGWLAAVEADLAVAPLSAAELDRSGDPKSLASRPALAYGTTLLVLLAVGSSIVACQIGDGEVVAIKADGSVFRPLPADSRLVGTRTTSLASRSAITDFRSSHVTAESGNIEAVVAATDGYVNSFSTDDGFAAAGRDLWKLLHDLGPSVVRDALAGWLESTSSDGTGDDATLAILYDRASLPGDTGGRAPAGDDSPDRGGL